MIRSIYLQTLSMLIALGAIMVPTGPASAWQAEADSDVKTGYVIEIPVPLESRDADQVLQQLNGFADSAPAGQRITVVMRYFAGDNPKAGDETAFEDALKLARAITKPDLRKVRVVSWVEGEISGHSTLPIVASELLIVSPAAAIGNASAGEGSADETILASYRSLAARRGLIDPAIAEALVDPELELVLVSKNDGDQVFATGQRLVELRQSGEILSEEVWSAAGVPLRLEAKQLRSAKIAAGRVDSLEQAAELLDLADLSAVDQQLTSGQANGAYLEIAGAVVPNRSRRWQSNLTATLESGEVNTWVVSIDSAGGSLDSSAALAGWFAQPDPPLRTVAGLVRGEARGDAALVALSCKPLFMKPEATIGGPGAQSISIDQLELHDELIQQIALSTKRPEALIRGLLNPDLVVYRYTNKKTGRIRYATEEDLVAGVEDAETEQQRWARGEQIDLTAGLDSAQAIALGLADGESRSLEDTSRRVGLSGTPPAVADRGLIRFVEKIGRSNTLAFLLLFIGFSALSTEANAPGLSVPGFIALVCFGLYFWMKFLAGTAEWLELVAFSLGIICIAIEVFVVPGFGIFGIGGLALTVLGIVLMSQTFVIPRNVYQMEVLTRGLWMALGGAGGMIGGFIVMRMMFPHVPVLRGLIMEAPDDQVIRESEKLADFSYLLGQTGTTTTPLRPSGKVRFGDEIVQVVSDGTAIGAGETVRVHEVHGPRVVVELLET